MPSIHRGDLFFVELGPTRGRELNQKRRPVVVLSIDAINRKPLVVTVVPGGTTLPGKRIFEHQIEVTPTAGNGLSRPTTFQCFRMKALDHSRFDQPRVGVLSEEDLYSIEQSVKLCLGLP